ncbi:MAG TPA: gamma-glutamyl-gamma-aminobutyrate hydrolase family protein [Thermoanaerobaculia bacterium]|jgi:putative glutamine amidotransferase|nr:gamma-glutamyl-gamma-aminobutyrate hydrolase family protein [Thermoanaerobaculia bacterium]
MSILVSASTDEKACPYVEALRGAGVPVADIRIVKPSAPAPLRGLAEDAAGLVLCGGVDVAPERYGETVRPDAEVEVYAERDELEWSLLDLARERRLPVWGVCRGFQVLNVYFGGSLWQDLPTQYPSTINHSVTTTPDTLAHTVDILDPGVPIGERITGRDSRVNSRHHQAVKRLADGLVSVALSPDGLIEAAFLDRDDWWVRGVQWHPENLVALDPQRDLWQDFVRAVGVEAPVR